MRSSDEATSIGATTTIGLPRARRPADVPPDIPDYRFVKVIGRGAFGTVWLAEEPLAGVFRAVKVLDGGGRPNERHAHLTNRELEGLHAYQTRARNHPHLIQVFKTGICRSNGQHVESAARTDPTVGSAVRTVPEDREAMVRTPDPTLQASGLKPHAFIYYVMEIADHARGAQPHRAEDYEPNTLASLIRRLGRLPLSASPSPSLSEGRPRGGESTGGPTPQGVIETGLALLDAIEHLHEAGIHHRDVKPSNILFVDGVLKLADLGLAATANLESVGTSAYLPPAEQASADPSRDREGAGSLADGHGSGNGQRPDDLYAFGKVLYEMVTGLPASAFPEWPGDLGATPRVGRGLKSSRRGSYEASGPSAPADPRLAGLCRLVNRLCHPEASKRLTGLGVCRGELERIGAPVRAKTVPRRRVAVLAAVGIPLSLIAGGYLVQAWIEYRDSTVRRHGGPPFDGSETVEVMNWRGRHYQLARRHRPGAVYEMGTRTVVKMWDLQSRLSGGRFEVYGAFEIRNIENPLPYNVEQDGGDINQLYLAVGATRVLLYHGQQAGPKGVRSRFGRSVLLDQVIPENGRFALVSLLLMSGRSPAEAERNLELQGFTPNGSIQIAEITGNP